MDDYLFKQMPLTDLADFLSDVCDDIKEDTNETMVAMHIILEAIAMRLREEG
jgi:hypothetical protein